LASASFALCFPHSYLLYLAKGKVKNVRPTPSCPEEADNFEKMVQIRVDNIFLVTTHGTFFYWNL
jgi:hypothetical protein